MVRFMSLHPPARLRGRLPAQGCAFESLMLANYFSATCDPINPQKHTPTLLVAKMLSSGITISPERLAFLLSSRFGGLPMAYRVQQTSEGIFEFKVASVGIAVEIALRGRLQSGCILLSLSLKQHNKTRDSVLGNHLSISAPPNNGRGQNVPDSSATKFVPFGKSARHNDLILSSSVRYGISTGFATNAQQRRSYLQSDKAASPLCPQQVSEDSGDTQNFSWPRQCCDSGFLSPAAPNLSHLLANDKTSDLPSYKSVLLSRRSCSPTPKISIPIFQHKPKNLDKRCYRCLSYSHFIAQCRDPLICWLCRGNGHVKKNCPFALLPVKPTASIMEPIVLGRPTSMDVHCPPSRDLNSLVSAVSVEPASPAVIPDSARVSSTRFAPSSQNSRAAPEFSASLSRMGNRARRSLHQLENPNHFDLLAFLTHSNKVEIPSSFGHTPHATVTFEKGAFHICLELSPCRIIETWILVSQVDGLDEPTFPCYNISSGTISGERFRSLLLSMLPDSDDGPVLHLLPTVDCRYRVKPVVPLTSLATEVPPLSLPPLSQNPTLMPLEAFKATLQCQQPLFFPSPLCASCLHPCSLSFQIVYR